MDKSKANASLRDAYCGESKQKSDSRSERKTQAGGCQFPNISAAEV
jgi:hypothetical protein